MQLLMKVPNAQMQLLMKVLYDRDFGVEKWVLAGGLGELKCSTHLNAHGVPVKTLAAHCPLGGHDVLPDGTRVARAHGPGACKMDRVVHKGPIGFLGAWLLCSHHMPDCEAHSRVKRESRVGALDYESRVLGRRFLLEEAGLDHVDDLIALETEAGIFEELLRAS